MTVTPVIRVGGLINSDDYENKITLEDMGDFDTTSPDPLDVMNRRGDTRWVISTPRGHYSYVGSERAAINQASRNLLPVKKN